MARGRMLSKTLSTSRKFAKLGVAGGEFAQLLYPLLVAHADDFGRQSGDAFTVKHQVFPTSPRSEEDFDAALTVMVTERLIDRYVTGDNHELVIQILDFERHQSGLHKRTISQFPDNSGKFPEIPSELKGREENLTELNRREARSSPLIESPLRLAKLRETHAFVGSRLRVPNVLHSELRTKLGGDGEARLQAWYQSINDAAELTQEPIPDVFSWLRPRFVGWCDAQGIVKPAPKLVKTVSRHVPTEPTPGELEALETQRRRLEMQAAGLGDFEIEIILDEEYQERRKLR